MSRKSARIAAKPPKPFSEDVDESDEEVEEEVEVKSKGKRAAPAKAPKAAKGKAKADEDDAQAGDAADAGAEDSNKKQKVDSESPDTSNSAVSLATLAESAKGSRTLKEILTINPSATTVTTTTTTTTTTTSSDSSSSTTVVTIKELESAGFEKHFDEIADTLLNKSVMFINGLPHRLLEVEFYFNGHKHVDDFAHCNERQKTRDQWYFHMTGKAAKGGFKGGSYKGLDVTFGDDECYGGILLRALQPLFGDFKPVDGPSLLVDHVLRTTNATKIEDLVARFDLSAETNLATENLAKPKHPLFFVHTDKEIAGLPKHKVYKGARVGLSMKAFSEGKQNYVGKFYRYLITPDKIKKGMHYLIPSLYQQGMNAVEIIVTTKSTPKSVEKYIQLFDGGKKKDFKKFCGVNLSNDEVCEMVGSCAKFCYPAK